MQQSTPKAQEAKERKENGSHKVDLNVGGEQGPVTDTGMSNSPSSYLQERPTTILVGSGKQYFIHKGLFAAKSPFLRTMFKDCWDGNKEEVELSQISDGEFRIIADWVYSGQLPVQISKHSVDESQYWECTLRAHKAADVLMMYELQNKLIVNEAASLLKKNFHWNLRRLRQIHDHDLCHTKYYEFVVKSVTVNMIAYLSDSPEEWSQQIKSVEDIPSILADMLTSIRQWLIKPWKDFPKGDLSEFLIKDTDIQDNQDSQDSQDK